MKICDAVLKVAHVFRKRLKRCGCGDRSGVVAVIHSLIGTSRTVRWHARAARWTRTPLVSLETRQAGSTIAIIVTITLALGQTASNRSTCDYVVELDGCNSSAEAPQITRLPPTTNFSKTKPREINKRTLTSTATLRTCSRGHHASIFFKLKRVPPQDFVQRAESFRVRHHTTCCCAVRDGTGSPDTGDHAFQEAQQ